MSQMSDAWVAIPTTADRIDGGPAVFNDVKSTVRAHLAMEHRVNTGVNDGGHLQGSAISFFQASSSAPTTKPGSAVAFDANDLGRLWYQTDTGTLMSLTAIGPVTWTAVGGAGGGGAGINLFSNVLQSTSTSFWISGGGSFVTTPTWSLAQNLYNGGGLLIPFSAGSKTTSDYYEASLNQIMNTHVGKTWAVQFSYYIDAGSTLVDGDVVLEYYDGTSTIVIGNLPVLTGTVLSYIQQFWPTNTIGSSCKFRIRAKVGTTTTGNLRLAAASIGPSSAMTMVRRTGWIDYPTTPTLVGLGTPTISKAEYMIDGDELHVHIKGVAGTPTAVEARLPFPTIFGAIISKSDIPTIQVASGLCIVSDPAAALRVPLIEPSVNYFTIGWVGVSGSALTKLAGNLAFGTSSTFDFWAKCKIAQFSVEVSLAGVSDPLYLSNSESTVNTNGVTGKSYYGYEGMAILANTAATYYDVLTSRAAQPGEEPVILMRSKVDGVWVNANIASVPSLDISNFTTPYTETATPANNKRSALSVAFVNSGQIRLHMAASVLAVPNGSASSFKTWAQVVAAADGYDRIVIKIAKRNISELPATVSAVYSNSDAAAINVPINFSTVQEDTHKAVTVGAGVWKFTAPFAGVYSVITNGSPTAGHLIEVRKNGASQTPRNLVLIGTGGDNLGSTTIRLQQNDYIDIRDVTGTAVASVNSVIRISKIG